MSDPTTQRDLTQERKDRVIPALTELYSQMASYDFKHNFKTEDLAKESKQEAEHEQYRKFVTENVRQIILDHDLRFADMKYLIQLTTTVANLTEEVTQEVNYDARIIQAAHAIMDGLSKEANLAPMEQEHNKSEEIARNEKKLTEVAEVARRFQTELVKQKDRGEEITAEDMETAESHRKQLEFIKNYLEDLNYKQSNGYVVFRDYMRRIVVPVFEQYDIKFYEASSVFAVISNVVDNIGKTTQSILETLKHDTEAKLWDVKDIKNDLTVKKMLDIFEKSE